MTFDVLLTEDALRDLEDITAHIAAHDSPQAARRVLDKISDAVTRLSEMPDRGNVPPELLETGIRDYREVRFKPYRILYVVIERRVHILLIADGRRDLRALLERRLLSG
ncbi:MAG TPA: type II toxin-antitoxin system RelE/ParE family toxin [Candidatus Hydrogenedentes bacterium]|nr:type II toxin-antitoxin system RelE/ParE family toxin [Candidatus Hydrogenedentota bacterium]HRZ81371.1 type II toxin-antitoxin system RelE/ParE family toxin [Candidatus Hydrogenedentota bacterium]